ncbi:MAG: hypothetical protein FWF59_15650 [Turicibacter sp.]|nr:hypothetical protein [Turicibacter sp.]
MKKFEYRLEHIDIDIKKALGQEADNLSEKLLGRLSEIGNEGWRLCGVNGPLYYFSREIA